MRNGEITSVGTIVECKGKILILKRNDDEKRWGLPGGKVEAGESTIEGAVRELFEESGYKAMTEQLEFLGEFRWNFPKLNLNFFVHRLKISEFFNVKLDPREHTKYQWVTPRKCYKMKDLINGFHDLLEKLYSVK